MKVSVIIPTYNEEKVIGECLESLAKQSYKDMEIIVVDDGSTDKTRELVGGVKLLTQNHKGPGEARNFGVEGAKGKILVFVDADMTFNKEFIKKLVQPIISGESKGTFSKDEEVSNWENVWSRCWNINQNWVERKRHPKNYSEKQKVFRAILKSEFDRVGGFNSGGFYTDDWTLSQKLGYEATKTLGTFYHENPDNLVEIFNHAKWVSKRPYKLGGLGNLISLVRASFPISLLIGIYKSIKSQDPNFLIFKIIYDLGTFVGIISYTLSGKGAK